MIKRRNRTLSLLLAFAMVLSFFPVLGVAVRAEAVTGVDYTIYVGASGPQKNDSTGEDLTDILSAAGLTWDSTEKVLTLDGFVFETSATTALEIDGTATIELGDNPSSITGGGLDDETVGTSIGLKFTGETLAIANKTDSTTGSLTITAGEVLANNSYSYGILMESGDALVVDASVEANAGNATWGSSGVKTAILQINDGGELTANGGECGWGPSNGVEMISGAGGSLTINGGSLNATGANSGNTSHGVLSTTPFTMSDGVLNATSTSTDSSTQFGMYLTDAIEFTGGTITAKALDSGTAIYTINPFEPNDEPGTVDVKGGAEDGATTPLELERRTYGSGDPFAAAAYAQVKMVTLPTYTIEITLKKDGEDFVGSGKLINLYQDGEEKYAGGLKNKGVTAYFNDVVPGEYQIYGGTLDSGETITVVDETSTATVNYYTVSYAIADDPAGISSGSTISAIYSGKTGGNVGTSSGSVILGGTKLTITATGKTKDTGTVVYNYSWSNGSTGNKLIIDPLNAPVELTCTVTGVKQEDFTLYFRDGKSGMSLYTEYGPHPDYDYDYTDNTDKWSVSGNTLTLEDGFAFATSEPLGLRIIPVEDVTINVKGSAAIWSGEGGSNQPAGIQVDEPINLTISGGGTLNLYANKTTQNYGISYGMYTAGSLTVDGTTVNAYGGDATYSRGMLVSSDLTAKNGGTVYGECPAGNQSHPSNRSSGIMIYEGNIKVMGADSSVTGLVSGTGGSSNNCGISWEGRNEDALEGLRPMGSADGSTTSLKDVTFTIDDGIAILKNSETRALYVQITSAAYYITFDANEGSVSPESAATGADGKLKSLPTPTRDGYDFKGWFTAKTGGNEVTLDTVFDDDVTIYAQWSAGGGKTPGGGGGSTTPPKDTTTEVEDTTITTSGSQKIVENDDGSKSLPSGGTLNINNEVKLTAPNGTTIDPDGTVSIPDGKTATLDLVDADAKATVPGGSTIDTNGTVTVGGGKANITLPKGSEVSLPEGSTISGNKAVVGPGGATVKGSDGKTYTFNEGEVLIFDEDVPLGVYAEYQNPFRDVKENDWFWDAVRYVFENGVMKGTSANTFDPNVIVNRAMMAQIVWNLEGQPSAGNSTFDDVQPEDWFNTAVAWAAEPGIVLGIGGNKFAPLQEITREQMAAILYRYCEYKGITLPVLRTGSFADGASIEAYAAPAVNALYQAGILNGKDDGNFDPQGAATRAEIAQMMMNFIEATK